MLDPVLIILGEIPWATFFFLEPSLPTHHGLTGLFSRLFLEFWETVCAFQRWRKRETGPEADMYLPTGAILIGVEVSGGERGVTWTVALIYSKRSLSLLFSGPWSLCTLDLRVMFPSVGKSEAEAVFSPQSTICWLNWGQVNKRPARWPYAECSLQQGSSRQVRLAKLGSSGIWPG